jgi:hypothetical protein
MTLLSRHAKALAACAGIALVSALPAFGDVVLGNRIGVDFGRAPVLSTTLHGRVSAESQTVAYTVSGTFKIGRAPVAKLRTFSGVATTRPTRFSVRVSAETVRKLRSVGRRRHAKRTTLTLTERIAGHATVFHEDKYLLLHR